MIVSEVISSSPSQKSARPSCRLLSGSEGSKIRRKPKSKLLFPTRFSPTMTTLPPSATSRSRKLRKFSILIRERYILPAPSHRPQFTFYLEKSQRGFAPPGASHEISRSSAKPPIAAMSRAGCGTRGNDLVLGVHRRRQDGGPGHACVRPSAQGTNI